MHSYMYITKVNMHNYKIMTFCKENRNITLRRALVLSPTSHDKRTPKQLFGAYFFDATVQTIGH